MSSVRNADDFLLRIRTIRKRYEQTFGHQITRLRVCVFEKICRRTPTFLLPCDADNSV